MHAFLSLFASVVMAFTPVPTTIRSLPTQTPLVSFGQLKTPEVAGVMTETSTPEQSNNTAIQQSNNSTIEQSITPSPTPKPKPVKRTKNKEIKIAMLGDSMTDTLGPDLPHLKNILKKTYPNTSFTMKNYGVGGTNIEYGITRITNGYTYLGTAIPALTSERPDVIIVESFGYNPIPNESSVDRHWLAMAKVIDTIRSTLPQTKIVMAATIAPNRDRFGDGAAGLSFSAQDKLERTTVIKTYIESTIKFAASQKLPIADAYHPSLDGSGNGKLTYINGGDHIHYSDAGRALISQKIAQVLINQKLLE